MARRKPEGNNFHSVSPVKFTTNPDGTQGWSQTIRRMVPEKSFHWDERKKGRFNRDDVHPCNEGFPAVVRIGPVNGGWPMIFELVLADGTKTKGSVSPEQIDGTPSWLALDGKGGRTKKVSYYDVAGWSSPEVDYPLFERAILWLIDRWPGKR